MAVNGLDAYRDAVEAGLAIAQRAAERITAAPPRRTGPRPRAVHRAVPAAGVGQERTTTPGRPGCCHDQIGFVTPTSWEGETVARFAFLHPNTTVEMVDEILASMAEP